MYVKRDGSLQGPLWPRDIKAIVEDKIMKVSQIVSELQNCFLIIIGSNGKPSRSTLNVSRLIYMVFDVAIDKINVYN